MRTLLIVEDEKMIRQGIAAMAKRCSAPVEQILECRNGVEALEILKSQPVDVMFTDIRMPKMDGIELVKKTQELENRPLIVVVSGFDDFNYAVEMMKNGVRDYLLKPIKRDKVEEILNSLDKEIQKGQQHKEEEKQNLKNQLRYCLFNENTTEVEWNSLFQKISEACEMREEEGYFAIVGNGELMEKVPALKDETAVVLEGMENRTLLFMGAEGMEQVRDLLGAGTAAGISDIHRRGQEIKDAYEEAVRARKTAFLKGSSCMAWSEMEKGKEIISIPEELEEQFLRQFSTDKMEDGLKRIQNYFFEAKHKQGDWSALITVAEKIRKALMESYGNMSGSGEKICPPCDPPEFYETADSYLERFAEWVRQLKLCLKEQFDSDQNRDKIQEAVQYIRENYQKDLNMAMVSNYVSMNYSLFSVTFKEYTGVNFVNYLKNIRIGEAKRMLETTDEKIVDISRRVGYENEKHFMKTFKTICGVSPSEYRKSAELLKRNK